MDALQCDDQATMQCTWEFSSGGRLYARGGVLIACRVRVNDTPNGAQSLGPAVHRDPDSYQVRLLLRVGDEFR